VKKKPASASVWMKAGADAAVAWRGCFGRKEDSIMKGITFVVKMVVLMLAVVALAHGPRTVRSWYQPADERLLDGLRLGDREGVELALEDGASVNAAEGFCGHTALIIASSDGDLDMVRTLLLKGAAIDSRDRHGRTALSHAAYWGRHEVVRELIQNGAKVDERDNDGLTPLARSAILGHASSAEVLLHHGAEVESADGEGATPLMLAASATGDDKSLITLLISAGANPHQRDGQGRTALEYAPDAQRQQVALLLNQSLQSRRF
jgi:ankyrin repeat protein